MGAKQLNNTSHSEDIHLQIYILCTSSLAMWLLGQGMTVFRLFTELEMQIREFARGFDSRQRGKLLCCGPARGVLEKSN